MHGKRATSLTTLAAATGAALLFGAAACGPGGGDAAPPGPHAAGGTEDGLQVPGVFYLRPPGDHDGMKDKKRFHLTYDHGGPGDAGPETGRLTLDLKGAGKVASFRQPEGSKRCTGDAVKVCRAGGSYDSWAGEWDTAVPAAAPGSKPGDTAVLKVRYRAPDGTVSTARTRLVVGEPVLEVRQPAGGKLAGVAPGSRATLPISVRNTGEVTARGLHLTFAYDLDEPLEPEFRNCAYPDRHTASCDLPDVEVPPGRTVTFTEPLGFRAPEQELWGTMSLSVWPLDAEPRDASVPRKGERPDSGPELKPGGGAAGGGVWAAGSRVWTDIGMDNHADYRALGATVHGAPGDQRKVEIGVRNNGPAEGTAAKLEFTVPGGATVVKQPQEEIDEDTYEPLCDQSGRTYTCPVRPGAPGDEAKLAFTLRLGDSGTGTVHVRDADPGHGRHDSRTDDDTASVVIEDQ